VETHADVHIQSSDQRRIIFYHDEN
jgi:hypothetical protein